MVSFGCYDSPVGFLHIKVEDSLLTSITIESSACPHHPNPTINRVCQWFDDYFTVKESISPLLSIKTGGTTFQREVWDRIARIPSGTTVTYGQIADEIARIRGVCKISPQAVGQAVRANPIAIIIPCHRVVGAKNKLTGYRWGLEVKEWLLNFEKSKGL